MTQEGERQMKVTKETVLSAEQCTGMQISPSNEKVIVIHVVPNGDYDQPVLCFNCDGRAWFPKSQDSYWSCWDSMLMLEHFRFYTNEEALAILEKMDAFHCPCIGFDEEGKETP